MHDTDVVVVSCYDSGHVNVFRVDDNPRHHTDGGVHDPPVAVMHLVVQ